MNEKLNDFGKYIIDEVRNTTIDEINMIIDNNLNGEYLEEFYNSISNFSDDEKELIKNLIPRVVDTTLHYILFMIEQHQEISLKFENEELKEISDNLCGELYGSDGWIRKFSNN